jgi:hypothetical protein
MKTLGSGATAPPLLVTLVEGLSGQLHAAAAASPGERTLGTHCVGGRVGPRAGLDYMKRKDRRTVPGIPA